MASIIVESEHGIESIRLLVEDEFGQMVDLYLDPEVWETFPGRDDIVPADTGVPDFSEGENSG